MNVYEISYRAALDGEYRENVSHFDPWARYFDVRGASVKREYGDSELELGPDHLQNVVNLICSGRKHGIDEIVLSLDHQTAQKEAIEHFYALLFLPEVKARFERKTEPLILQVTFEASVNTSSYRATTPDPDNLFDSDVILDEIDQEIADEKMQSVSEREPFSLGMDVLFKALKSDSRRTVELPQWVIEKYGLKGNDLDCSKSMADSLAGLAEIFGWEGEKLRK